MKAILCLDQATTSGWALISPCSPADASCRLISPVGPWAFRSYGSASRTLAAVDTVLRAAVDLAGAERDLVVVFEDHGTVPARFGYSTSTLLGMGAARGYWEHALDAIHQPKVARYRVAPEQWRAAVLGTRVARAKKDAAKAAAVQWAHAVTEDRDITHDVAEALCIAAWASTAIPRQLEIEAAERTARRKVAT